MTNELFSAILNGEAVNNTVYGIGTVVGGVDVPWLTFLVRAIRAPVMLQRPKTKLLDSVALSNISLALTPDGGTMSANVDAGIHCTISLNLRD